MHFQQCSEQEVRVRLIIVRESMENITMTASISLPYHLYNYS